MIVQNNYEKFNKIKNNKLNITENYPLFYAALYN